MNRRAAPARSPTRPPQVTIVGEAGGGAGRCGALDRCALLLFERGVDFQFDRVGIAIIAALAAHVAAFALVLA